MLRRIGAPRHEIRETVEESARAAAADFASAEEQR
jgi:hypothetical protein